MRRPNLLLFVGTGLFTRLVAAPAVAFHGLNGAQGPDLAAVS
jgi:hypothetical protein